MDRDLEKQGKDENSVRACGLSDRSGPIYKDKIKERIKRKERTICRTNYTAWCNRIEKDERKFYHEVKKEKIAREEKMKKIEMKRQEKENFVRQFYPSCLSSRGGTQILVPAKPTDIASAVSRRVGKVTAEFLIIHLLLVLVKLRIFLQTTKGSLL